MPLLVRESRDQTWYVAQCDVCHAEGPPSLLMGEAQRDYTAIPGPGARILCRSCHLGVEVSIENIASDRERHLVEELQNLDPSIDMRPGSVARTLVAAASQVPTSFDAALRASITQRFVETCQEGRARFGRDIERALSSIPLPRRPDYAEIGRRIFPVESLPPGALPIYDRDPGVADIIQKEEEDTREGLRKAVRDPSPLPSWCRVGVLVCRREDQAILRVKEIVPQRVLLEFPRTLSLVRFSRFESITFEEAFTQPPTKSRYDFLLEDED